MYICSSFGCLFVGRLQRTSHLTGWEAGKLSLSTQASGGGGELWGVAGSNLLVNTLELLADLLDTLSAGSRDGGSVSVVGVDTSEIGSNSIGLESSNNDLSWASVVGAVTA